MCRFHLFPSVSFYRRGCFVGISSFEGTSFLPSMARQKSPAFPRGFHSLRAGYYFTRSISASRYKGIFSQCYSESGLVDIDSIHLPLHGPKQIPEIRLRPRSDEFVVFSSFLDAGLSFPPSSFVLRVLSLYHLQLHHLTPVAVATMSAFA